MPKAPPPWVFLVDMIILCGIMVHVLFPRLRPGFLADEKFSFFAEPGRTFLLKNTFPSLFSKNSKASSS